MNPDLADNVLLLVNGVWNTYYHNNTRWTRRGLGSPDSTNQAVKPEVALLFSRIGAGALTLSVTGSVPMSRRYDVVSGVGLTFLGSHWPVDQTLLDSKIHEVSGWVSGATAVVSDQVLLLVNNIWNTYWWDGSNWRRSGLGSPISNTQIIKAGTGVLVKKVGTSPVAVLTQLRPF